VWLEAHRQNDFMLRPAQDASAAQRFGNVTAAGVLQLLLPLLVILLTFGAFAGEREQGTLRQVLALGVSRRQLATGKALGLAGALALLLVPASLVGGAALTLGSAGAVLPTLGRGTLLVLAYLAYFGVFVAVSLAVSARARSSRTALVLLLGFWILNGLVAPRVAVDLSKRLHPAPTAFQFASTMRADLAEGVDQAALQGEVLARYGVSRVEDLPVNFAGIRLQAGEEHGDEVFDRRYGELWSTFEQQSRVHEAQAVVAPLLAVRALSMGLSGTDVEQHRHFADAAETYRRGLVKAMNDDLAFNSAQGQSNYRAGPELWERVQPFAYEAPKVAFVLGNRWLSVSMLGLWVVGSLMAAAFAVRTAPVT
jgi:ABC-2 type transport system permease protein